ncbi:G protein-regulated inducer of neurite outgrowth 1 [Gouania willdenowi]|uniref:G protein-regulated inducer of neurite outgrowth C-terminal domain-containing protein n=1 Tax=Gouania willdenowi TaxID=441366 RepID=A0A8C5HYE9_GOUWI|nr:G protein-regulated inducer of neurite outgrowth 1 [Gouania willdenowi]
MESLKDEKRDLGEHNQPCEKTDDGLPIERMNCSTEPEGSQQSFSQESTTQENCQTKEKSDSRTPAKNHMLSEGGLDHQNQSDSMQQRDETQAAGEQTTTIALSTEATISISFVGDREEDANNKEDENMDHNKEKHLDMENILSPVLLTSDHTDPCSPAPSGQQHMRTQVSLEVVQCCSAATSPMTPPEGGHSFFFPNYFGKVDLRADTKDAELQVGQVEFCSVATSPMTPRSPSTTAFPELTERETVHKDGWGKSGVEQQSTTSTRDNVSEAPKSESRVESATSKEINPNESQEIIGKDLSPAFPDSPLAPEKSPQQSLQLRMGSMDQDITILVTHYVNNEEEENTDSLFYSDEQDIVVEQNKEGQTSSDGKEIISTDTPDHSQDSSNSDTQFVKSEEACLLESHHPAGHSDLKKASDEQRKVSVTKCVIPESPAPFGCHNIRTQVSLEVVQCQSAATSPMTPPEGEQAFYFPSSVGKSVTIGTETRDAELQVGQEVEFRSVATAPMTPRTPVATTFPDIRKESSVEEKIVEEEEKKDAKDGTSMKEGECSESKENETAEDMAQETDEEKCEEPVQEVNWDEKGMTWEVYGAVVEVSVLGSAIQKHLEKQVKKQKMPPPPPLNPSATPLTPEAVQGGSGSGKGRASKRGKQDNKVGRRRRNPFRQLMENMQQPHCCSRAHTTE